MKQVKHVHTYICTCSIIFRSLQNHNGCKDCLQIATLVKFKCCRKLAFENTVKEGHHRIKNPSNRYNLVPRSQRSSPIPYHLACRFVNLFLEGRNLQFEFPKLEKLENTRRCLHRHYTLLTFLFLKSLSTTEQTELLLPTSAGRQKTELPSEKASLAGYTLNAP